MRGLRYLVISRLSPPLTYAPASVLMMSIAAGEHAQSNDNLVRFAGQAGGGPLERRRHCGTYSVRSSTEISCSGESGIASKSNFHSGLPLS